MSPRNTTIGGSDPKKSLQKKFRSVSRVLAPRNTGVAVLKNKQQLSTEHAHEQLGTSKHAPKHPAEKKRTDLRDDAQEKPKFLAALNLLPKKEALDLQSRKTISPSLKQRLRSRNRIVSYFRKNPVPLSSAVGQKIIQNTVIGKCGNPEEAVKKYEKNCKLSTRRCSPTATSATKSWPQVNVRRLKQASTSGNVHKYTNGKKQRMERLAEIVIGLNKNSFEALNQCQGFDIRVHRMTDEEIAFKIAEIEGVSQSLPEQGRSSTAPEVTRWISSEPVPSTSSGIETVATPVIKLWDFMLDAPVAKKSSKSMKKPNRRR